MATTTTIDRETEPCATGATITAPAAVSCAVAGCDPRETTACSITATTTNPAATSSPAWKPSFSAIAGPRSPATLSVRLVAAP